ncbi:hypothetical protein [Agromyces mangrovi Wang et al. 2018]|uniref:hypothetical protein n=1 Tax=Agromyces mangrovi TaxID=1858653 RepID=UPI0025734CE0|nr:hypothetical protein [Agromyces mangrovi]
MIADWFRAHRSGVLTAAASTATVALVAGVALASGGYRSQRVDLGDASVWVANGGLESVGRLNTAVRELDTAVETGVAAPELVQRGGTVLVVDAERANLDVLDPATATIAGSVAIPPVRPEVSLAGERVVIASDGDVWSTPIDEFAEFDSQRDPDLTFGAGTVTATDADGMLVAFTPSTARVARIDASGGTAVEGTWQVAGDVPADADWSVTTVGGHWALLDATNGVLHVEGGAVPLGGLVAAGGGVVLQEPAVSGDAVLVAHRGGLLSVPFDAGEPVVLVEGRSGSPPRPWHPTTAASRPGRMPRAGRRAGRPMPCSRAARRPASPSAATATHSCSTTPARAARGRCATAGRSSTTGTRSCAWRPTSAWSRRTIRPRRPRSSACRCPRSRWTTSSAPGRCARRSCRCC